MLAQDETDLLLFPPLRAGWARRGQAAEVRLSGWNARQVVFGTMNLRTGHRLFLAREHQRARDFQAFLERVHEHYRAWQVALLVDEDPSHTAKSSVALATDLNMTLIWLPKRAPKLNPIDTLWGQAKDAVSANKQYASLDEQVERFLAYLSAWSNREALTAAGVCAPDFWLSDVL
ncbi:MAG: transposase [Roseiflexaceae bacterium]